MLFKFSFLFFYCNNNNVHITSEMEQKFKFNLHCRVSTRKKEIKGIKFQKKVNLTQNKMNYNS